MYELSKQFRFEAAHTLEREIEAAPGIDVGASRRVHGHSYRAEVSVRGWPAPATGMIVDLGVLERSLARVRDRLDHHFLNDVAGLGPTTLENLSAFIWRSLVEDGVAPARVTVARDASGDACAYTGPEDPES
jgi:6-pyruvoyltetrahydropterin/6-carboxytetrahydropterin synthase